MTKKNSGKMIFGSLNYKLLVLGLLLIAGGFTAMYIENEVYGVISLYVSPIVILAGYIVIIFAILLHNQQDDNHDNKNEA